MYCSAVDAIQLTCHSSVAVKYGVFFCLCSKRCTGRWKLTMKYKVTGVTF